MPDLHGEFRSRFSSQSESQYRQHLIESSRAVRILFQAGGQAFTKDAARTSGIEAEEFAGLQLPLDTQPFPRQVARLAQITTMHARGRLLTGGATNRGASRLNMQNNAVFGSGNLF